MACDVKIQISGIESPVSFKNLIKDPGNSPILEIAKAFANNPIARLELASKISKFYSDAASRSAQSIGNISYNTLKDKVPIRGGWPDIDLESDGTNILYIDKYNGMHSLPPAYKLKIKGKEVRVQPVYKDSLNAFRNYITAKKIVLTIDENTIFSEEFNVLTAGKSVELKKDILKEYLNIRKIPSLTFLFNNKILDTDSVLSDEIKRLSNRLRTRVYKNEVMNYIKNNVKKVDNREDKYDTSLNALILKLELLTPKAVSLSNELLDELSDEEKSKINHINLLQKYLNQIIENYKKLSWDEVPSDTNQSIAENIIYYIDELIKEDPEFPLRVSFVSSDNDYIRFNLIKRTIYEKYGLSYGEVQEQYSYIEDYRGFDIYSKDGRYYYTQGPLRETDSKLVPLASLEDIKKAIDDSIKYSRMTLLDAMNKTFKKDPKTYNVSTIDYEEGDIIKSLDVNVPSTALQNKEFKHLIYQGTYYDFEKLMKSHPLYSPISEQILQYIDTPEKAGVFLYMIDGDNFPNVILDKAKAIGEAGYRYFIVLQGDTKIHLRTKEILPDSFKGLYDTNTYKIENTNIPTAETINAIVKMIEKKLDGTGYNIVIKTLEEIKKEFAGIDNKAKAFISGKTIVINGTTADILSPLHEYAHLFLGLLKARNYDTYRKLVDNVLSNYPNPRFILKAIQLKKNLYRGISEYDAEEEVFADIFSRHLIDQNNLDYFFKGELVESVNTVNKLTISELLDNLTKESRAVRLNDIWKSPLSVLTNLNSEVILELEEDEDGYLTFRQAANWILKLLKDMKIKEICE